MKLKTFINCTLCIVALGFLFALTSCGDTNGPSGDSDTKIVSFTFADFTPAVVGTINHTAKTVALKVPPMTNKQYLVPTIVLPAGATISPASGILQNFNIPVQYTVTAKDGSTAIYTVTVTEDNTSVNPIVLSGTYSNNTDLPNVRQGVDYYINDRIYITETSLLKVAPGVTIEFTSVNGGITIEENAGLEMKGTALNPIILKGPAGNPNKASWAGIDLNSNREDNVWEYVQIINGGKDLKDYAALTLGGTAKLSMQNCTISGAGYYGMALNSNTKLKKFENNLISDCMNAPIYFTDFIQVAPVNNTSSFTGNTKQYIEVGNSTYINTDLTINELSIPYFAKQVYVEGANLTISPGVQIIFDNDGILGVNDASKIVADGTPSKPILFTAKNKEPGQWKGIELHSTLSNSFAYATIEYGGQGDSQNLYLWTAKVILNNVNIKNSSNYGVYFNNESTINHSQVTFVNNANGNVYNYDDGTVAETLP